MERKNIIILIKATDTSKIPFIVINKSSGFKYTEDNDDVEMESWGGLKDACNHHPEFNYSSLSKKKFPFVANGYLFLKLPFKSKFKKDEK